ncbi:LuxR C-terminal-related transcriptional regulator [Cellulomonas hominis]
MDAEGFGVAVAAVQRWLPLGHDVLLRGDRGSGKTTVLESLLSDASRRGATGLLLRANGQTAFAALLDHASVPTRTPDETVLADWLGDELRARNALLLVDDVDRMDGRSLAVVRRVLGRCRCQMVASTTADPLHPTMSAVRAMVTERAPAEVWVPPFGFRGVSSLLASVLGAPADSGLTSAVLAQTGGNPRAAVALVTAARAAGALHRAEGFWVEDGTLGEVPADAVVHLFLSALDGELVAALELLAGLGPVPADVAARIVDPVVLTELVESGRLVCHDVPGIGQTLGLAPPVLARALRERVGPFRRGLLAARVATEAGPAFTPATPRHDELTAVLLADTGGGRNYWRWTAELAGMVHERAAADEAARRDAWLAAPTVGNANAYLALLMRRPAADQLESVFRDTRLTDRDRAEDRLLYRYYEARWAAWRGIDGAELEALLADAGEDLGPLLELRGLKQRISRAVRDGVPAEVAAASAPVTSSCVLRGRSDVVRAGALLEAGRPDLALRLCEDADDSDAEPQVRHYLAALHGESLMMLDRLLEAERWERRLLDAAYADTDALGIRVHTCVLAEVLYFAGRAPAAWRVVSTGLRIGAAGPIETTYYRRGLTLGAVLQAHAGNVPLAQALVRELDKAPRPDQPLIRSLHELAHVALGLAAGDLDASAQLAWQSGARYAEDGLLQPALLTWAVGPPMLTPARARIVRQAQQQASAPLLEPYLRLQLALADGDRVAVADALSGARLGVAPALVRGAERFLGLEPSPEPAVYRPDERSCAPDTGADGALSPRECEVATLARTGMSNRQIAEHLRLSVRTVENHMSRALRKLGLTRRAELIRWHEPEDQGRRSQVP